MYMQGDVQKSDKRRFRLPEVCALAKTTEKHDEKRPITAQEFICQQESDLFCLQAS